ncbi:MAG: flavin reductase family protein [Candidatus Omnitrophota bacterium]|nr:flavin reductase family protein [Candidatus Omnitrophota bacterium]
MKIEIEPKKASRIINCGEVILVSCASKTKTNIITLAWHMPVSQEPATVAICVAKTHFSHRLIEETGEFVINVPTWELLPKVIYCGSHSGAKLDKFKESGLMSQRANRIKNSPLIKECVGHLECQVRQKSDFADHSIFIGEVAYAFAEESLFDEVWQVDKVKLIFHLGGKFFTSPEKLLKIN